MFLTTAFLVAKLYIPLKNRGSFTDYKTRSYLHNNFLVFFMRTFFKIRLINTPIKIYDIIN